MFHLNCRFKSWHTAAKKRVTVSTRLRKATEVSARAPDQVQAAAQELDAAVGRAVEQAAVEAAEQAVAIAVEKAAVASESTARIISETAVVVNPTVMRSMLQSALLSSEKTVLKTIMEVCRCPCLTLPLLSCIYFTASVSHRYRCIIAAVSVSRCIF